MKWTAEADAHVLECQNISVDYKTVAANWTYGDEQPTPKALTEHMGKLRKMAAAAAANAGTSASGQPSPPSTMKKAVAKPRRKRKAEDDGEVTPAKAKRGRKPAVKNEPSSPSPQINEDYSDLGFGTQYNIDHISSLGDLAAPPTPSSPVKKEEGSDEDAQAALNANNGEFGYDV